jgi:hypothetical protein
MNRLWIILLTATAMLSCAAAPAVALAQWVTERLAPPASPALWFVGALMVAGIAGSRDAVRWLSVSLLQRWRSWRIRRVQHRWSRRAIH